MAYIDGLNKAFENKVRLGVMSILMANEAADFTTLKTLLQVTDGNLASHTRYLEEAGYISCTKKFVGRKPNTEFSVTESGRQAFAEHIQALENLLHLTT